MNFLPLLLANESTTSDGIIKTDLEAGHAKVFYELEKGNLCICDDSHNGESCKITKSIYIYNPHSRLWMTGESHMLFAMITTTMSRILNLTIESLLRTPQESNKNIEKLKKCLSLVDKSSYVKKVTHHLFIILLKEPVTIKMNCHPDSLDLLPIKQGCNIDLKTGLLYPRKRENFFTYECLAIPGVYPNLSSLDLMISLMVGADKVRNFQTFMGLCLTGWRSPLQMIILSGSGRFQLLDPLMFVLDKFHCRLNKGLLHKNDQKLPSLRLYRCVTSLDDAIGIDQEKVNSLSTQSIKLIVVNTQSPKQEIPHSAHFHVNYVKGVISPNDLLAWLIDGVKMWYSHSLPHDQTHKHDHVRFNNHPDTQLHNFSIPKIGGVPNSKCHLEDTKIIDCSPKNLFT